MRDRAQVRRVRRRASQRSPADARRSLSANFFGPGPGPFLISGFFGFLEVIAFGAHPLAYRPGLYLARAGHAIALLTRLDTHAFTAHWTFSLFHVSADANTGLSP